MGAEFVYFNGGPEKLLYHFAARSRGCRARRKPFFFPHSLEYGTDKQLYPRYAVDPGPVLEAVDQLVFFGGQYPLGTG